jgi:hypothetical protein
LAVDVDPVHARLSVERGGEQRRNVCTTLAPTCATSFNDIPAVFIDPRPSSERRFTAGQ